MSRPDKPVIRPANPSFSSGPCAKRPGWSTDVLGNAFLGRSHRSREGKARLERAVTKTRALLGLPDDYHVGIMPGSDTGAFEAAMWSMLGARGVDVLAWESFGKGWVTDIIKHLKLDDVRILEAAYGRIPDLSKVDFSRDVVFTWNGTTSGVRVPDGEWIPDTREGLTFVDATSAVFAQTIDWAKTDVVTYSWQKVLGSEGAHGMLILSPRAVARLESYVPDRPLPKLFRLTKKGRLDAAIFEGETINTPSMLAVEDYLDALSWADSVGGAAGLMTRTDANAKVLFDWIERTAWVANLAVEAKTRSNTSVCLSVVDRDVAALPPADQSAFVKGMVSLLEVEQAAFDIGSYRDAPSGLRIWTGATVETTDVEALTPWLDWAFAMQKATLVA